MTGSPPEYDVCIVGAGMAGGISAHELARQGLKVLVLEAGARVAPGRRIELMQADLNGEDPWKLVDPQAEVYSTTGDHEYPLEGSRMRAVGGSTHHWGGLAYRMHASDFRLKSTHGIGEDWPLSYDDLEPFYGQAERELGVAGGTGDPFASPRSTEFPLPAFPFSYADTTLVKPTCDKLGIGIHTIPYARNSAPYQGRPACQAFGMCHVCPIEAMYNGGVHVRLAEATGRVEVRGNCTVLRLNPVSPTRLGSVTYADPAGTRREVTAHLFVLAAHTIESIRLLLLSRSSGFPNGLANRSGTVGRYFMEHFGSGMAGVVGQPLYPQRIGFNTAHSLQYHDTPERARIGAIKLTFASGGLSPAREAAASGRWGREVKKHVRAVYGRTIAVVANVEQLPHADNWIGLDRRLVDRFGDPAPEIHLSVGLYERRTLRRARDICVRILRAAGARIPLSQYRKYLTNEHHRIAHHMGGCRMGTEPRESVVDPTLKAHDLDNLFVLGSSVFPTGGVVNPTLTIAALALRATSSILTARRTLAG